MDRIDQALGPLNGLPTSAMNVADAISEVYDHLSDKPSDQLTLTQGVQIVRGGNVPAILYPTFKGRTLVNLLGRDGNCEDINKVTLTAGSYATLALDASNKLYGNNGYKLTYTNAGVAFPITTGFSFRDLLPIVDKTKCIIVVAEVKNGTGAYLGFQVRYDITNNSIAKIGTSNVSETTKFTPVYAKFSAAELQSYTKFEILGHLQLTASEQYGYFDGFRVYQISQEEYNALSSMTGEQIAACYPYVDDMKHVNAVYIENKGKNLLPPFSEWAVNANAVVSDAYKLVLTATANDQFSRSVDVGAITEQSYTFSVTHNGKIKILGVDVNGNFAQDTGFVTDQNVTLVVNPGTVSIRTLVTNNDLGSGTFTFQNPMLNIGDTSLPFEPQKPSYLYLPDCNLRSNVDGSVADRLYTDGQGKPRVTRRFRKMVLEGTLGWEHNSSVADYKRVRLAAAPSDRDKSVAPTGIKFDGKVLGYGAVSSADVIGSTAWEGSTNNGLLLTIANIDSGWGNSYTPTADEIKAYFYGWKMSATNTASPTSYLGTGQKYWYGVTSVPVGGSSYVSTLPTELINSATWQPYRLIYQLAQSTDEPVTYEGSLMLHEGANQVEVGTGIVVREAANPILFGEAYYINNKAAAPAGNLKNRTNAIHKLFRDSREDKQWTVLTNHAAGNGGGQAYINKSLFDPSAVYSVTYLVLDTYTLGIAPQTISAAYASNIRESVESLVRELVESRTETSVLQNTKAQKRQSSLSYKPTTMSGWVINNHLDVWLDEFGVVNISGDVRDGTIDSPIFVLPPEMRPGINKDFIVNCPTTTTLNTFGRLIVYASGNVTLKSRNATPNNFVVLNGISFRAGY